MSLQVDRDALASLCREAKELYLPKHVPRLSSPPTPITFLRNYVMPNLPVVIENGISHWPALTKWTKEYLRSVIGDKKVTVATTPNGYADATVGDRFVLPHESCVTFDEFLHKLDRSKTGDEIVYVQNQNSSFLQEFSELVPDAGEDIPWASEALGRQPDAVNFWMGSSRSVTSMHKDHYENLYGVVAGSKTFILHPPTDLSCVPYEKYVVARYTKNAKTGKYEIVDETDNQHCEDCNGERNENIECNEITKNTNESINETSEASTKEQLVSLPTNGNVLDNTNNDSPTKRKEPSELTDANTCSCNCHEPNSVPWIAIDPLRPDYNKYQAYRHANRLTVTLEPGDVLYLPSLWFHHVQQSDDTIAVNFWYDMEYDIKYNYYKFVEHLIQHDNNTCNSV